MTEDLAKHYREVFVTEINRLKLKDTIGFALEGPAFVPGPQGLTVGWSMMVTLKHNKLIGQPDIGVHVPLLGMTPEDDLIREGAKFLIESAREERHKLSTALPAEGAPLEGQVIPPGVPVQGDGTPVPAGLLGPGIGGTVRSRAVAPGPAVVARSEGKATDLAGNELSPDGEVKSLPHREEPTITDSDSGTFKIVDKRRRKRGE